MISASTHQIPQITGVLLLDCWESHWNRPGTNPHATQQFFTQCLDPVAPDHVRCVINCLSLASIDQEDRSFINTLRTYAWDRTRRDQYRQRCSDLVANVMSNTNWPHNRVSRLLHDQWLDNDHSIQLRTERDFYTHWRFVLDQQVNDWLVVGQHWDMCVATGSLGLDVLAKISSALEVRFYATDRSFLRQDGATAGWRDFLNDNHDWCHVQDWGYRLLSTAPDDTVKQFIICYF